MVGIYGLETCKSRFLQKLTCLEGGLIGLLSTTIYVWIFEYVKVPRRDIEVPPNEKLEVAVIQSHIGEGEKFFASYAIQYNRPSAFC